MTTLGALQLTYAFDVLIDQVKLVATNVSGKVVKGSGHWLMEEAPKVVIPTIVEFVNGQ